MCHAFDRFHRVAKKGPNRSQLSGGQQPPGGIARTLIAKPALIPADKSTGNLHSDQAREIMKLFRPLNQEEGVTIIQVTRSDDNASYGIRTARLADGLRVP